MGVPARFERGTALQQSGVLTTRPCVTPTHFYHTPVSNMPLLPHIVLLRSTPTAYAQITVPFTTNPSLNIHNFPATHQQAIHLLRTSSYHQATSSLKPISYRHAPFSYMCVSPDANPLTKHHLHSHTPHNHTAHSSAHPV